MHEALPTPPEIAEFPELAVLAVLDYTLNGCVRALVAAHPELDGSQELPYLASHTAQHALRVVSQIWKLKHDLEHYRYRLRQDALHQGTSAADTAF